MDTNQVNFWFSMNAENFAPETLPIIKGKLEQMNDSQMMFLQGASFKKPSTIFLVALLLGWERFLLGDIALGIVKVITGNGCGIWWLIDVISAKKRTYKYNFELFQKLTALAGGGQTPYASTPSIPSIPSIPSTPQTNHIVANNNIEISQSQTIIEHENNTGFNNFNQNSNGDSLIARMKNILFSPKTAWASIDKSNSSPISYLFLLALIPAAALFLGYLVKGIYYAVAIPYGGGSVFGNLLLYGFLSAITGYIITMVLGFLSALVPFLLSGKFNSVNSYNKALALIAYSMTPLCLFGILLLFPASFWLWLIAGVIYGKYLICSGTKTLLRTPLEKHALYVSICTDIFMVLAILLGLILFAELQAFEIPYYFPY